MKKLIESQYGLCDKLEDIYDLIISCNYKILLDKKEFTKAAMLANKELIDLHIYPN